MMRKKIPDNQIFARIILGLGNELFEPGRALQHKKSFGDHNENPEMNETNHTPNELPLVTWFYCKKPESEDFRKQSSNRYVDD